MINFNNVKIFSGSSNLELAKRIAVKAGLELGKAEIQRFKDGEVYIEIEETVRGRDVFVVQSTSEPVNENLMELLIFVVSVSFFSNAGVIDVCREGVGLTFNEELAKQILSEKEVTILIDIEDGTSSATCWGCDLTYDYVKINGDYRN